MMSERPRNASRLQTIKHDIRRIIKHENAILLFALLILIGVWSAVSGGKTARVANVMNVLLQSAVRGVASIGQAFVILSGGIDVSIGGLGLLCSIAGGALMTSDSLQNIVGFPMSPYIAVPIMLLLGSGVGAANGLSVSRIGMPALIVTLAMWRITNGAAFQIGGGVAITYLPDNLPFLGQGYFAGVPVPAIIFIVVAVMAYFVLQYVPFGRAVYAVGGNPVSAWLSGINVKNMQLAIFVISGFLAGLSAAIFTARVMSASMRSLIGLEIDSIAAVCVGGVSLAGGRGSIIGTVIGVLIIGVVGNGMSVLRAGPAIQGIVTGAIIFGAVAADYIRRSKG